MKKWVIAAVALVIAGIPAAYAASPNQDKPKAAQAQTAEDSAAKQCKAERDRIGVQAFKTKYGTNNNKANAFGKCVSGKSKDKAKDEKNDDKGEADKDEERGCKGVQSRASLNRRRGVREEVRNEPQPEERLWQVRLGQVQERKERLAPRVPGHAQVRPRAHGKRGRPVSVRPYDALSVVPERHVDLYQEPATVAILAHRAHSIRVLLLTAFRHCRLHPLGRNPLHGHPAAEASRRCHVHEYVAVPRT